MGTSLQGKSNVGANGSFSASGHGVLKQIDLNCLSNNSSRKRSRASSIAVSAVCTRHAHTASHAHECISATADCYESATVLSLISDTSAQLYDDVSISTRAHSDDESASKRRHVAAADVQHSIRSEKRKEIGLQLNSEYMCTPAKSDVSCSHITPAVRMLTISWLGEAAAELGLAQETLYLGVSILDRFLSKSQGCPRNLLQLVAIAALSLAAKVEEVKPPSMEEMSELSANYFKVHEIVRMEFVLLDELEWQTRMPTSYSFLRLYQEALQELPARTAALASYLTELSLLHYEGLQFVGSVTAGAALLLANMLYAEGHADQILGVAEISMEEVYPCVSYLAELHNCAALMVVDDDSTRPLAIIREKHMSQKCFAASDALPACAV